VENNDDETGWSLHGLRRVIFSMLDERDKRYEQRFLDQTTAIHKQENAIEKRFESVNELRGALDDAAKLLMPRSESNARYDAMLAKIEDHQRQDNSLHSDIQKRFESLSHRIDIREGAQEGGKEVKNDSRSTWAIVISVAAVIVNIVFIMYHK
jgi:chromosome segregation ATPase